MKSIKAIFAIIYYGIFADICCCTDQTQLFVETMNNKVIKLEVNNAETATVAQIKQLIRDKEKIPIDQQILLFNGTVLNEEADRRTLSVYKIHHGSKLELKLIPFEIEIEQMMQDSPVRLEVHALNTINDVMQMLHDQHHIVTVAQALYLFQREQQPLLGAKTLAENGISQQGTKLELFLLPTNDKMPTPMAAPSSSSSTATGCCTIC